MVKHYVVIARLFGRAEQKFDEADALEWERENPFRLSRIAKCLVEMMHAVFKRLGHAIRRSRRDGFRE